MKTAQDFLAAAVAKLSSYPTIAQRYQARDPQIVAQMQAIANMLAMLSSEIDTAAAEPWTKARDVTVLADASIKGVLPFGKPATVQLTVVNADTGSAGSIMAGRILRDTQGRAYTVTSGATIPAGGSATITAVQRSETTFTHTVAASQPFYTITIPQPEDGQFIAEVRAADADGDFAYVADFVNIADGDRTFNLETDETRTLTIQFGASGIAGFQPDEASVITVTVIVTEGAVTVAAGSEFSFEYTFSPVDSALKMTLSAMTVPGAAPMDIATMREVITYPSIYDQSAVYLGNFDFLIRRNLSPLRFLSVWNEQIEESIRGPDQDNINTLFIAALADGVAAADLQELITAVVKAADDSYKIKYVTPAISQIAVAITVRTPSVYDQAAVAQQIREQVLAEYGADSAFAKRGRGRILYKRLYDLLVGNVQALQGPTADFQVTITDPDSSILPEHYRYVSTSSLSITVTTA